MILYDNPNFSLGLVGCGRDDSVSSGALMAGKGMCWVWEKVG